MKICLLICKIKLVILVEGDPKAPFSIATTLRCRGGRYSFRWIAPLYSLSSSSSSYRAGSTDIPDPLSPLLPMVHTYLIMLRVKQSGIKFHFLCVWYDSTWDWNLVSKTTGEHSNHFANSLMQSWYVLNLNSLILCEYFTKIGM